MTTVKTKLGKLRGESHKGIHRFLGIPYAQPPVGDLRFAPPVPAARWDGERDATAFGPTCPQSRLAARIGDFFVAFHAAGEDCLNLNVWTPDPGASGLPVLVWIHGGAFQIGAGSDPLFDGTAFARDGSSPSPSTTGWASRASSISMVTERQAVPGCSTRSQRWAGCKSTSPRSAATLRG